MFYPVDSLKRGGRFYLCWVADSWPLRFTTLSHRQLRSQDVRKICDDLAAVIGNESGRPTNRFSLRLSSQLMRGLVRLYEKKVNVFLSELCMINAYVTKHANKKSYITPVLGEVQRTSRPQLQVAEQLPLVTLPDEPENEQRIEDIIKNSSHVVINVQDITLKEATIPEFQLPPNDGFGEEIPEQALQLLGKRSMELMMAPGDPSAQLSGLELALDGTDRSHDRLRLAPDQRQMERVSERDLTMLNKSTGEDLIPEGDFEKEIQIPEISDILIPDIPIPPQEKLPLEPEIIEKRDSPRIEPVVQRPAVQEPEDIELEELEETEPQAKRRRFRKIIIDKKTKITTNVLRARIDNPHVDLRCENSSYAIIEIRVPCEVYMQRPSHAGASLRSNVGLGITRLFMRNLGLLCRSPRAEREFQEGVMDRLKRPCTRSDLEPIVEIEEPIPERPQLQIENTAHPELSTNIDVNISKESMPQMRVQMDISEALTQKIETLSEQARKRKSTQENVLTPKKQRSLGYIAFRESQQDRRTVSQTTAPVGDKEADKENIPKNMQSVPEAMQLVPEAMKESQPPKEAQRSVTALLQEAGLADLQIPIEPEVEPPVTSQRRTSRPHESDSSETLLGSVDRTKVSLGDSGQTTDSKKFIRDHWGTEGTMIKILKFMKYRPEEPITVKSLISKGPLLAGYKTIMAARCFTSILKLKQHGFIVIKKCPDTLEIMDIKLGSKFDEFTTQAA